jgi:hypothetical protein
MDSKLAGWFLMLTNDLFAIESVSVVGPVWLLELGPVTAWVFFFFFLVLFNCCFLMDDGLDVCLNAIKLVLFTLLLLLFILFGYVAMKKNFLDDKF